VRLAEYGRALDSWSHFEGIGPVIVCEASEYPEDRFREEMTSLGVDVPFEYVSCRTRDTSARQGKGRAELDLMIAALSASAELHDVDRVLKATGRYVFPNAERVVDKLLRQRSLPDVQVNLHRQQAYADSRLFMFSHEFLDRFLYPMRTVISDSEGVWLEHVAASAVARLREAGGTWKMMPESLRPEGVSGTTGLPFESTARRYPRLRHAAARARAARLLPKGHHVGSEGRGRP
jgi:hypothetical protein